MIHCVAMQMGFQSDVYFCNTMIDAYVKRGCFVNALRVFDEMPYRDLVSWTSMISGYVYEGNANGAFGLFNEMQKEVEPNEVTIIVMLQMCSSVLEVRQFHGYVIKCGSLIDQSLKNSILKMYTDIGSANDSEVLFQETPLRDVVSWNIMIHLYSSEGNTMKIIDCLNRMRCEVKPSIETFTVIISGLEGCEIIVKPLLGFMRIENREYAAEKVLELESDNAGYYTLFSNVQASVERWDEVEEVRSVMKEMNLIKHPGWSCLEVKGVFHGFVSGDRLHDQVDEIYAMVGFESKCIRSRKCLVIWG
ncbi:hypothetical protein DH2020_041378 [Rehmannia glutinosa]|uniref:Pentatricopeptide repeat-containing protein n=1 Tax=Rehmannia glutinosa TaxID=99300 RepID=A0ABR0USF2_REHGL